jgi:beta-lactamase superfamily II metal-dependent hydrolase
MKFTALKALRGDAFVITWKENTILVDGGMPNTYSQIKRAISGKNLKSVFVTHVDYDHLGGIIGLVSDEEAKFPSVSFYMNHPDLITSYEGSKVAFQHGETLRQILNKRGVDFKPASEGDRFIIDELSIEVLSPNVDACTKLHDNWDASRVIEDGKMRYLERQRNNGDIINRSSLVLAIEYQNKKILMLGDTHAEVVEKIFIDHNKANRHFFKFDLVKLSHHGSKHNTSSNLLRLIDCHDYYISTNGAVYGHPDSEVIKILSDRAVEINCCFNVYLNYDIEKDIRDKCDFEIKNLKFILQKELFFNEND